MSHITRRDLFQVVVAAAAAAKSPSSSASLDQKGGEPGSSAPLIEVYTDRLSAAAGDLITIHVSTVARRFNIEMARIGRDENVVWRKTNLVGSSHPTPEDAWQNGCRWPVSATVVIPKIWRSGYYQIRATVVDPDADPAKSDALAFVVVRAMEPTAKILFVIATSTYGAYNNYGGASFYVKKKTGLAGPFGMCGEHRISFQRPWLPGFLWRPEGWQLEGKAIEDFDLVRGVEKKSGFSFSCRSAGFYNWERIMVRWLEENDYQVDYAISSDLEFHPTLLSRYRLMITAGHDEYWSWGMRDTVEQFTADGGNVCFFSANIALWQIRYENSGSSMVCYKFDYEQDPYFHGDKRRQTATFWSSRFIDRPQTQMAGSSSIYGGLAKYSHPSVNEAGVGGFLIYRPEHWVFDGTSLTYADGLGVNSAIAHYETDGLPIRMESGVPYPVDGYGVPSSLQILGMVPVGTIWNGLSDDQLKQVALTALGNSDPETVRRLTHANGVMTIYTKGGIVFSAGTTDWVQGLTGKDPAVERVTKNLLNRLSV